MADFAPRLHLLLLLIFLIFLNQGWVESHPQHAHRLKLHGLH